jgi:hypothetical protein
LPQRLTKIDDLSRPDHTYLTAADDCYFIGEYTARQGYAFSSTNNLIVNFKKSVQTRNTSQWPHKERAIGQAAAAFRAALNDEWLNVTLLHGSAVRRRGLDGVSGTPFLTLGSHRAISKPTKIAVITSRSSDTE